MSRTLGGVDARILRRFVELNLLEETGVADTYKVHDWAEYNPSDPTAAERSRRYRNRDAYRDANRDAAVTKTVTTVRNDLFNSSTRSGSSGELDQREPRHLDPAIRCPECLQPLGHGHLEDCPLMPATLPDWEPGMALDSGVNIPPETSAASEPGRSGEAGSASDGAEEAEEQAVSGDGGRLGEGGQAEAAR